MLRHVGALTLTTQEKLNEAIMVLNKNLQVVPPNVF